MGYTPVDDDIRFERREDDAYLAAVKAGDMETAQRITDEAGRAAGLTGPLLHYTDTNFDTFDDRILDKGKEEVDNLGHFFGEDPVPFGEYVKRVFLDIKNPARLTGEEHIGGNIPSRSELLAQGYDSVIISADAEIAKTRDSFYREDQYVALTSGIIKSAEPIVRDDKGKVIPPSERFAPREDELNKAFGEWIITSSDISLHANDILTGVEAPASLGGRMKRRAAAVILNALAVAPKNLVTLYRGSTGSGNGLDSWTSHEKTANYHAKKSGGRVVSAPPGSFAALKVPNSPESEYIVSGVPLTRASKALLVREISEISPVAQKGLDGAAKSADGSPRERARDQSGRDGGGRDSGRTDSPSSSSPLDGAPRIEGASGPDPRLVNVARDYAKSIGLPYGRQKTYAKVDLKRAKRIADAYDAMAHDPTNPVVAEAYADLIQQTMAQYRALEAAGYRFWLFDDSTDPYGGSPWEAMRDLRANQSMAVYATEAGFGSGATKIDTSDNPLMVDTGLRWPYGTPGGPMKRVLANDLFRAVHDAFGHGLEGAGFRAQGEENAWQSHVKLFTGPAVAALTSETRGQNNWLNFGPHGEANRTAPVEDTVFADQKSGLMPEWTWTEGRVEHSVDDDIRFERREDDTARFNELTKDLDPKDIEGWKANHPAELAELTAMRERVLRGLGYNVRAYHGTTSRRPFTEFKYSERPTPYRWEEDPSGWTVMPGVGYIFKDSDGTFQIGALNVNANNRKNYQSFDEAVNGFEEGRSNVTLTSRPAFFFATNRLYAEDFARQAGTGLTDLESGGGRVMPVFLRKGKAFDFRDKSTRKWMFDWVSDNREYLDSNLQGGWSKNALIQNLKDGNWGVFEAIPKIVADLQADGYDSYVTLEGGSIPWKGQTVGEMRKQSDKFRGRPGLDASINYAVFDPNQIKSADPLALDNNGNLITPDQWGDSASDDIRFERRETPIQTGGQPNRFFNRPPSSQKAMEETVNSRFNHEEIPLDSKGQQAAIRFLGKLLDPKYVEGLKALARRNGVPAEEAAIVAGVGRSAVLAYAGRLAETDPAAADRIRSKVEKAAKDLLFLFDGSISASIVGKALRSLRSYIGGGIQALFAIERNGRQEFVEGQHGTDALEAAKAIADTDVDPEQAEDLADRVMGEIDPEAKNRMAEAEKAARSAWKRVADLIAKIYKPLKTERREGDTDGAFNKFQNLANSEDASLDDIEAAFEALFPLLEADLTAVEKTAIRRARTATTESTKTSEEATRTTRTGNQVDIMAKRRIGLVDRATNEDTEEQARLKKDFRELVSNPMGRDEFLIAYVKLGGTAETGSELYDANVKLLREGATEAEEKANGKAKKAKADLQDRVDFMVGELLDPTDSGNRPTSGNDTPRKVLKRYTNLKNARLSSDALTAELRKFKDAQGNQLFTADQIEAMVIAAGLARSSAEEAQAARKQASAEAQIKNRTEVEKRVQERKAETAERQAERDAAKLQDQVDKLVGDLVMPATKDTRPTSDNNTPRKVLTSYVNPKNARLDSDTLAQVLRDFKKPDGTQLLSEPQIASLVTAAELARAAAVDARSVAAEEQYQKAARRDAKAAAERAGGMFSPKKRQQKDPEQRTLRQIILEDFINNPLRKILTQAERIEFAEEILREKTDLPESEVKRIAVLVEAQLAKTIEELKFKAVTPFLKALGSKALSRDQIAQAIRLEILDPGNDFVTSIAALSGWEGLSPKDSARLAELQKQIDLTGSTSRTGMRNVMEQARIIDNAIGIMPSVKDLLNSYVRGNIFSAATSQSIGLVVGVWENTVSMLAEALVALYQNKGNPITTIEEFGVIIKSFSGNLGRGAREALEVLKTGSTYIDQVKLEQEKSDGKTGGKVFIDPLTRQYDDATVKMQKAIENYKANPGIQSSKILWQAIRAWVLSSGRFTFRGLFAIDAAVTKINSGAIGNIFAYREARRLGLSKEQIAEIQAEAIRTADSHRMYLQTEAGLSGNLLEIEVRDAMEGAFLQALTTMGAEGLGDVLTEAASDIQDRIGTGETSKVTVIGRANEAVSKGVNAFPIPLGGLLPAIRTNGNVIDAAMWYAPGVGLYRAIRYNGKTTAERQAVFPNIRADWQFRRRQMMAALTNGATLALVAMLMANKDEPDDEKWFWYTGAFPILDKNEQARWQRNGWTEYTLNVGSVRIQTNRGFGQTLYPALVAASMFVEATDGVSPEEGLRNLVGVSEQVVPGFSQLKGRFKSTESTYGMERLAENQVSTLVPLSGLLQTPRRLGPTVDKRNTDAAWYQSNPWWTDTSADGVMTMKNVLGETLESDASPYSWVKKVGIPIQLRPSNSNRDPLKKVISEDFYQNKYRGGEVTLKEFRKAYGADVSSLQYKAWLERRVDKFVPAYMGRRDVLLTRPDDYTGRVGDVWSRAGESAARDLGLKKQ